MTLKSGTNQFKGIAASGSATPSRRRPPTPFVDRTLPEGAAEAAKASTTRSGFTFGGPIVRNKFFFFGDYVRTNDDLGPREPLRGADRGAARAATSAPRRCPSTTRSPATPTGDDRAPFDGNRIPANRISPIAPRILANVPLPNIEGAARAR